MKSSLKRKVETISIALHKKPVTVNHTTEDIESIAKRMRERVANATRKITITTDKPIMKPIKKKQRLRNMQLLKHYLSCVAHELKDLRFEENKIQFTPSSSTHHASLGATLIESIVHDHSMMDKEISHKQEEGTKRLVRRPGRPPKCDNKKKKDLIQCICDSPHEEFGSMVQCDDCYRWLHLECLELNQDALEETFRCPCCFLSLGSCDKNAKLLSSITWRYAAQWKSQRLAAIGHHEFSDDEDEEVFPAMDWADSSSQESEVTTPNEYISHQDPFDKLKQQIILDPESLEILSRIAYLQSLDSVRKEIFAPNASDVFLCENLSQSNVPMMNLQKAPRFASNALPSDICSQDLSEYSFDSGPFWEPLF